MRVNYLDGWMSTKIKLGAESRHHMFITEKKLTSLKISIRTTWISRTT